VCANICRYAIDMLCSLSCSLSFSLSLPLSHSLSLALARMVSLSRIHYHTHTHTQIDTHTHTHTHTRTHTHTLPSPDKAGEGQHANDHDGIGAHIAHIIEEHRCAVGRASTRTTPHHCACLHTSPDPVGRIGFSGSNHAEFYPTKISGLSTSKNEKERRCGGFDAEAGARFFRHAPRRVLVSSSTSRYPVCSSRLLLRSPQT